MADQHLRALASTDMHPSVLASEQPSVNNAMGLQECPPRHAPSNSARSGAARNAYEPVALRQAPHGQHSTRPIVALSHPLQRGISSFPSETSIRFPSTRPKFSAIWA